MFTVPTVLRRSRVDGERLIQRRSDNPCAALHHGQPRDPCRLRMFSTTQQPIPSLFAAGEVTDGVHGANRLGGSGLLGGVICSGG